MVNFVKVIAVQGNVVFENKLGDVKALTGLIKLPSDTKLVFSQESIVVIQLKNGRIVKIKGKDLKDYNGELYLNSKLFQDITSDNLSDIEKVESFATDYQNVVEAVDTNIIRLDDGRVFQRVGKDYVEVAADTFNGEDGGGNRFVQLTRIGEDGVADGISPLALNRISETPSPIDVTSPLAQVPNYIKQNENNLFKVNNDLNRPPQAIDDIYTTELNTPIILNPLDKDYDLDGKKIELVSINGQPSLPNTEIDVPNGKVIIDNNGTITFVPDFGFTGLVEFPYVIKDERGATSTAKEIITIETINTNSSVVVSEEGLANANPDTNGNTDTTDKSVESGKIIVGDVSSYTDLQYELIGVPSEKITSNGQTVIWELDTANNKVIGTINDGKETVIEIWLDKVTGIYTTTLSSPVDHTNTEEEDTLTLNIPYQVTDGQKGSVDGKIFVTVEDDSPIAKDDRNSMVEDAAPISGNVLDNDAVGADGHGQVIEANGKVLENGQVKLDGKYGTLTIFADGSYTYTLDNNKKEVQALKQGELIEEEFNYIMRDADGDSSDAKLTIGITGQNDAPVINTEAKSVVSEEGLAGGIVDSQGKTDTTDEKVVVGQINATDVDKEAELTYTLIGTPEEKLTSNGQPVEWDLDSATNTVTGYANGNKVVEITLDSKTGKYTVTLHAPVDHPEKNIEDILDFNVPYQVKDEHGASADGKINITVEDDSPIANDDIPTDVNNEEIILVEDGLSLVEGNVLENDLAGADGHSKVVSIEYIASGYGVQILDSGVQIVETEYGQLKIFEDGTYSFTLDNTKFAVQQLTDQDTVQETFSYTMRDADGDESVANLTIIVKGRNDPLEIGTEALAVVSEEGLLGGIKDTQGVTDHTDSEVSNGKILVKQIAAKPDVAYTYTLTGTPKEELTSLGEKVEWSLDSTTNTVVGRTANGNTVIEIQLNSITGEYTVTLHAPIDHPEKTFEDALNFFVPYHVEDQYGQSADNSIRVVVEDDSPIAVDDVNRIIEDAEPVTGNILNNDNDNTKGNGEGNIGAEGQILVSVSNASGTTFIEDTAISIKGTYGTLEVNKDGTYTYTLNDEAQKLNKDEIFTEKFTYVIRDADGDTSQAELNIYITGQNDAPVINTEAKSVVSEEGLASGIKDNNGNTDTTDAAVVIGQISVTDVDKDAELTYTLTGTPEEKLTSNGQRVVWTLDSTMTTATGSVNGNKVIELTLDSKTGEYTVTLHGPVDHPEKDIEDTLDFNVPYQVKDEHDATAKGNINVVVEDDSPLLIKDGETIVLDEKNLEFGSATDATKTTATGVLQVNWGADNGSEKDAKFTQVTKDTLEAWSKTTTQPFEVTLSTDGHTLIAKAGDTILFEVTLIINDNGEVEYQFTVRNAFNHGQLDQFDLPFKSILITDADGDSVNGSFNVVVKDDHPDSNTVQKIEVNEDLYPPTGGKPTNTIHTNADATQDNTTINGGSKTPHGTAVVNKDGTISYTPDKDFSGTDTFTYTTIHDDGRSETYTVEVVVNPISNDPPLLTTSSEVLCTPEDTALKLGLKTPQISDNNDQNGSKIGDQSERLGAITLTLSGLGTTKVLTGNGGENTGAILVDGAGDPLIKNAQGKYTIVLVNADGTLHGSHVVDIQLNDPNVNYLTVEQYEAIQAQPGANRHENFEVDVSVTSYEVDAEGRIDQNAMGVGSTPNDLTDDAKGLGATSSETIQVTVQAVTDNAVLTFDQKQLTGTAELILGDKNKQDIQTVDYTVKYSEKESVQEATVTISEDYAVNLKDITNIKFDDLDGSEQRSITIENPADSGGTIRVFNGDEWVDLAPGESVTIAAKNGLDGQTGDENSFKDIKIAGDENQSQNINGIKVTINAKDTDSDGAKCGTPVEEKDLTDNSVIINLEVKPVAGDIAITNVETKEDTEVAFLAGLKVTDTTQQGTDATSQDGEVINEVSFDVPNGWKVTAPDATSGWSIIGNGVDGKYIITFDSSLTEIEREDILSQFKILPPAHSSKDLKDFQVTVKTTDTKGSDVDTVTKDLNLNIKVTPVAERLEQIEETDDGKKADGNDSSHWKPMDTDGAAANANHDENTVNSDKTADLTMNGDHIYSYESDLTNLNFVYDRSIENFDPDVVYPPNNKSFNDFKKDNSFAFEGEPFYINQDNFDLKEGWFNQDGQALPSDVTGHKEQTYAKLTGFTGDKETSVDATFEYSTDGGLTWQKAIEVNGHIVVPMEYLDSVRVNLPNIYDDGLFAIKVEALTSDTDEDGDSIVYAVSGTAWLTNIVVLPTAGDVTLQVNQRVVMNEDSSKELFIRTQSTDAKEKFEINIHGLPEGSKIALDGHTFDTTDQSTWQHVDAKGSQYELVKADDGSYTLTLKDMNAGSIKPIYTPPLNSNTNGDNTELKVTANTTDKSNGFTSIGKESSLPIDISVIGVPDTPILVVNDNLTWVENNLDKQGIENNTNIASKNNQANVIDLNHFISKIESGEFAATPNDDSETLSIRITGLPEGFELVNQLGKPVVTLLGGEGEKRVWLINKDDLANISIKLPVNYSGEQSFTVQPVVTENDGRSKTFPKKDVSFTVDPSPEITLSASSDVWEDEIDGKLGQLNLSSVYNNGDETNEAIVAIRIKIDQLSKEDIVLYKDAEGKQPLTADKDGYIYLNANDAVFVRGPANFSGEKLIDIEYIAKDSYLNAKGEIVTKYSGQSDNLDWSKADKIQHQLNFKPVTDDALLEVSAIDDKVGQTEVTAVKNDQEIKISLNILQKVDESSKHATDSKESNEKDYDFDSTNGVGGEHTNYYMINNVPDGVIVKGAYYLGKGKWILEAEVGFTGALTQDIIFKMTQYADGDLKDWPITIDVFTQDKDAEEKQTSVSWKLNTNFSGHGDDSIVAPKIDIDAKDYIATEDVEFSLDQLVDVKSFDFGSSNQLDMTITVRTELGDGISLEGMLSKQVVENGKTVTLWYKTITGLTEANLETELAKFLQEIQVNTGENQNGNKHNLDKEPGLDISISLSDAKTGASGSDIDHSDVTVLPVTDPANISITTSEMLEDSHQSNIPIDIIVSNAADKTGDWKIIAGKMYFTVSSDLSGTLMYSDGSPVGSLTAADLKALGVELPLDGNQLVYVVEGVEPNTPIHLDYQLADNASWSKGDFELKAWVQNQENSLDTSHSTEVIISDGQGQLVIKPVNNIPDITVSAQGSEHNGSGRDQNGKVIPSSGSIQLNFTQFENMPHQTDEILYSAVLENIPAGFIVYYGNDAASAKMATNAGDGTWALPISSNELPKYISIKPPAYWSGTLPDLKLLLTTGESTLKSITSEYEFDFVVKPIADGIKEFVPTYSFNEKGSESVVLNLNIGMRDPSAADNSEVADQYIEVADLILTGFTDPTAVFSANGTQISADRITMVKDENGKYKYTITGLTQIELDRLEIFHQNTDGKLKIEAEAYTYEVKLVDGKLVPADSTISDKVSANFDFQVSGVHSTSSTSLMSQTNEPDESINIVDVTASEDLLDTPNHLLLATEAQDIFVWDMQDMDGSIDTIQGFDQTDKDQIDVSQLLAGLGWDNGQPLSDIISFTQTGEDTQLEIKQGSQSVNIVIENNTWTDLDAMLKQGSLKTDI